MKTFEMKIIIIGLLFLAMILSGVWLTKKGKPYPTGIFTFHKLIVLAAMVYIGYVFYTAFMNESASRTTNFMIILSAILLLLAFITGAILSIVKDARPAQLFAHKVTPILSLVIVAITLFLLRKYF
jgi:hypothetical protein